MNLLLRQNKRIRTKKLFERLKKKDLAFLPIRNLTSIVSRRKVEFPKTMKAFEKYAWPGNVRELENIIKRVILFGQEDIIRQELYRRRRSLADDEDPYAAEDLPDGYQYSLKDIKKEAALKAEREAILEALKRSRWNRRKAADLLAVSYKALLYKMKQTGISNA